MVVGRKRIGEIIVPMVLVDAFLEGCLIDLVFNF